MKLTETQEENKLIYDTIINQLKERHAEMKNLNDLESVLFIGTQFNGEENQGLLYLSGKNSAIFHALFMAASNDEGIKEIIKQLAVFFFKNSTNLNEEVAGKILNGEIMIADINEMPEVSPVNDLPVNKPLVN